MMKMVLFKVEPEFEPKFWGDNHDLWVIIPASKWLSPSLFAAALEGYCWHFYNGNFEVNIGFMGNRLLGVLTAWRNSHYNQSVTYK